MKLTDLIDALQSDTSAGRTGMGNQLEPGYLKKTIHSYRAMQIELDWKRQNSPKRINPSCYQRYYLQYSLPLQASAPCDAVLFSIPKTIALDKEDGIRWGGSLNSKQWVRIYNRGELTTLNQHSFTQLKNNPTIVYFLYDNTNRRIEVYNDLQVTEGMIEGVFSDPRQVQNFNADVDDYPVDENSIPEIRELIYHNITSTDKATRPEIEFNTMADNVTRPVKVQPIPKQ